MARAWGFVALAVALVAGTVIIVLTSQRADSAGGAGTRLIIPGIASDSVATSTPTRTPTTSSAVPQTPSVVPTATPSVVPITHYEAYAGGYVSQFTEGGICSLEQPFHLAGDGPPNFIDFVGTFRPIFPTQGTYFFETDVVFTSGFSTLACTDSSSGTYSVTFYPLGEADIIMTGPSKRVCDGVTVFEAVTESRIAIREAPSLVCP